MPWFPSQLMGTVVAAPTSFDLTYSIAIDTANFDFNADLQSRGWDGVIPLGTVEATLTAAGSFYSTSAASPAFDSGDPWPIGSTTPILIVEGVIRGKGGSGGAGSSAEGSGGTAAIAGGTGGTGMNLQDVVQVDGTGEISGGGGGGGGGGSGWQEVIIEMVAERFGGGGGGGGGGASGVSNAPGGQFGGAIVPGTSGASASGVTAGTGGTGGVFAAATDEGGDGGDGGALGAVGTVGATGIGTDGSTAGATFGAGGNAIEGNANRSGSFSGTINGAVVA